VIHLNGNVLCAVDTETTGDRVGHHDVIQICVLALNCDIRPDLKVVPFYTYLKPRRPENCLHEEDLKIGRAKLCEAQLNGLDPDRAADLFDEWFEKLGLAPGKRISPLAQNWPFDRGFLIDWLGHENFEHYFDARFRDTMAVASFENDIAAFRVEPYPYQKVKLQYLASTLRVEANGKAHDALRDCLTVAEVYRRMIHNS